MNSLPARRMLQIRRVWIDAEECLAHTLCEPEAPGLIEYSEDRAVYSVRDTVLKRTQEELKQLLEASYVCPMSAFRVTLLDGKTYNVQEEQWILDAIAKGDYEWA